MGIDYQRVLDNRSTALPRREILEDQIERKQRDISKTQKELQILEDELEELHEKQRCYFYSTRTLQRLAEKQREKARSESEAKLNEAMKALAAEIAASKAK